MGSGLVVTVNCTALLSFRLGATETTKSPVVAPLGRVTVIEFAAQELIVTGTAFSVTMLPAPLGPNPDPEITTWLPTGAVVADTPEMYGLGVTVEFTETLSYVALDRAVVLLLLTPNPT
jgi:hypothetical protein